jgi:CIC family chloride channel protein
MNVENEKSFRHIVRTISIAIVTGVAASLIVALFGWCLDTVMGFVDSLGDRQRMLLPIFAAALIGFLILRKHPSAGGEGVQFYITAVNIRAGKLDLLSTVLRFPVTIITLAMIGSGGIIGPLARMCGGAGSWLVGRSISLSRYTRDDDLTIGAICGVSGAVSAIFHAPLAAGLYASEVLQRESLRYSYLIVALLSAVVSYVTSSILLGEDPFFVIAAPRLELSAPQVAWLPVTSIVGGFTGMLFIFTVRHATSLFHKIPGRQPAQVVTAAVILSAAVYFGLHWSMKTSPELYGGLATGQIEKITSAPLFAVHMALPFILVILAKIVFVSITIGSGMSAGFTGPLIIIGMTLGALVGIAVGAEPTSAAYYGYMACGMAALLSATLNIPLAAIALTMTVFGTSYTLPAVTGSSIAFILFKGNTVFQYYGDVKGSKGNDG